MRMLKRILHLFNEKHNVSNNQIMQGSNNSLINDGDFMNVTIDMSGDNNIIIIGKNTSIKNALIFIRGNNHRLKVGNNCTFGEGELWLEDDHCSLIIHDNTTIEKAHLAVTEPYSKIEIHKDCMLARHIEIRTGDSHTILDKTTGERINKAANVTLEEHVWVGEHAIILKGVNIGHNSVIGTGALVTKNIPSNSIAGGVPAKIIKQGIDWKRERL